MMMFLWNALMFLVVVGPLIFFHELGHYWVGRWSGIRAEAFSIGFGQEVAGWTDKRGTRWKIGWIPLGGYVRFAGDHNIDGSPAPNQPADGFETAALWRRALTVAAGPVTNLLLAMLIYAGFIAAYGAISVTSQIAAIEPGSVAENAGFKPGDDIKAINAQPVADFSDIKLIVMTHANRPLRVDVIRSGRLLSLIVTPRYIHGPDALGIDEEGGHIGIAPMAMRVPVPFYAIPLAAGQAVVGQVETTLHGLGMVLTGEAAPTQLHGPVKIAQMAGGVAHAGGLVLLEFAAFISINLGFMNLLPVPVLDGGHLMFFAIEAVR
ncbi:MAG: site-2 protease family protein, partial [Alphaproteobacteria bacterium]|nr:site-2 protease family protein [Alphaproteobacteria bacterium]